MKIVASTVEGGVPVIAVEGGVGDGEGVAPVPAGDKLSQLNMAKQRE